MTEDKSILASEVISPKRFGWIIHVVAWAVLFCLPLILTGRAQSISLDGFLRFSVILGSIIIVFYTNYSFLVKRFLFTRKTIYFVLINLLLIIFFVWLVHAIMNFIPLPEGVEPPRPPKEEEAFFKLRFFFMHFIVYLFVAVLGVALKVTTSWYDIDASRKELERSRSEAELQNLKSQLNPHFLFNTLNNIYSLIAFSPEKAQVAVHDLSRLLRYMLYESSQPLVPLEKELDFIRNYVELMRIRLPENVELITNISDKIASNTMVAPLLFISLIENAFKHGVSNNKPSFIHIDIYQKEEKVICSIRNSDFRKKAEQDKSGSGIGLSNLRRRLSFLYPEQYIFKCGHEEGNYYSLLSINVNTPIE